VAFFALLEPATGTQGDYTVERCHINVWSLPGWLGHRPMAFDVGVLFQPLAVAQVLEMALPVRAAPRVLDLSSTLNDATTGVLLFGKAFAGVTSDRLQLKLGEGDEETEIDLVALEEKKCEVSGVDDELTLAKLQLGPPAGAKNLSYVRVRFVVDHPGAMWRWQRVLGRRNGALIDFRAPDPREERRRDRRHLVDRAKPMGELDAFFMLPERYRLQAANPDLKYTRTLEGEAWHKYLRRSLHGLSARRGSHQRLMVHRWHPELTDGAPKPVDREHPFRGFLQFNREPGFRAPTDLILASMVTCALLYAFFRPLALRHGVTDAGGWIGDRVSELVSSGLRILLAAGTIAVVSIIYNALRKGKQWPTLMRGSKRAFKRMEYMWFKILN
jgi:hypothetical protein